MKKLAIIGGGAAGLAAAVAAGERAREVGAPVEVMVLERDDRVGRSILATGNGRCNFSNSQIEVGRYHNCEFVAAVLGGDVGAGDDSVHRFFEGRGLAWREEADGRQYPLANKASVVVDVLRAAAAAAGAREACEREAVAVDPPRAAGKPFTLKMKDGVLERADAVVVACGGRAMASLDLAGLRVRGLRPVLGPLCCTDEDIRLTRELDNIRVRCEVRLARRQGGGLVQVALERGELMFRKYGVSGICVYDLSRFAEPGDVLQISFLPEFDPADQSAVEAYLDKRLQALRQRFGGQLTYEDMLRGLLLPRVYEGLMKRAGTPLGTPFAERDISALAALLTGFELKVAGVGDPDQCQVRRGGLDVSEFDPQTMAAASIPGLFAAGEALDVDGPCGGYNLHWAWASGLRAGESAVDWLAAEEGGN